MELRGAFGNILVVNGPKTKCACAPKPATANPYAKKTVPPVKSLEDVLKRTPEPREAALAAWMTPKGVTK
jgi:hypothetical protein